MLIGDSADAPIEHWDRSVDINLRGLMYVVKAALPQLLKYKHFEAWTGGVQGIVLAKPDPPIASVLGLPLNPDRWCSSLHHSCRRYER